MFCKRCLSPISADVDRANGGICDACRRTELITGVAPKDRNPRPLHAEILNPPDELYYPDRSDNQKLKIVFFISAGIVATFILVSLFIDAAIRHAEYMPTMTPSALYSRFMANPAEGSQWLAGKRAGVVGVVSKVGNSNQKLATNVYFYTSEPDPKNPTPPPALVFRCSLLTLITLMEIPKGQKVIIHGFFVKEDSQRNLIFRADSVRPQLGT